MEQTEFPYIADSVKWYNHFEKSLAVSYNMKHTPVAQNFIPRVYPREMKTHIHQKISTRVYSSFIYNSQKLETRRKDKLWYLFNGTRLNKTTYATIQIILKNWVKDITQLNTFYMSL